MSKIQNDAPGLGFSEAFSLIKAQRRLRRTCWEEGVFVFLVPSTIFKVTKPPLMAIFPKWTPVVYHPHVDIKQANGVVCPWNVSQVDLFAKDWEVSNG